MRIADDPRGQAEIQADANLCSLADRISGGIDRIRWNPIQGRAMEVGVRCPSRGRSGIQGATSWRYFM
jgi:hypothetical protein